jgi:hypothetical protein
MCGFAYRLHDSSDRRRAMQFLAGKIPIPRWIETEMAGATMAPDAQTAWIAARTAAWPTLYPTGSPMRLLAGC